jgi:hypothetical protein
MGTLSPDPLMGEGTEEEIRAARQAHLRELRITTARRKWPEIHKPERRGRFVVDLRLDKVFEPLRTQVWPGGDPRGMINEHVALGLSDLRPLLACRCDTKLA